MKFKRFFTSLPAFAMVLTCSVTAFAAEDDSPNVIPPDAHAVTIELTLDPAESTDDSGIMPLIWGQFGPAVANNASVNTAEFYVSDRYFAYEVTAIGIDGQAVNGKFAVALIGGSAAQATISGDANGSPLKADWITMTSGNYHFRIYNNTSSSLNFSITYYSWA